jgi:hypothetical protein
MQSMHLLRASFVAWALLLLSGCVTEYREFVRPERVTGSGGEKSSFHGMDLWTAGLPPGEFIVVGEIVDNRPCGAMAMCLRGSQIASLARQKGGDALILSFDKVGATWNAASPRWGASSSDTSADLMNNPIKQEVSKYYVIKYARTSP